MYKVFCYCLVVIAMFLVSCQDSDMPASILNSQPTIQNHGMIHRPIQDFISAQGTVTCQTPYGDEVTWTDPARDLTAYVDYCGLATPYLLAHGVNLNTRVHGDVTEQAITGGRQVHISLHAQNALTWLVTGMTVDSVATQPTIFGTRAQELSGSVSPAVSEGNMDFTFSDENPIGSALPDLFATLIATTPSCDGSVTQPWSYTELNLIRFYSSGRGQMHDGSGLPEGTQGELTVQQLAHNLFANGGAFEIENDLLHPAVHGGD